MKLRGGSDNKVLTCKHEDPRLSHRTHIIKLDVIAGGMTRQLRAFAVLVEDRSLLPCDHTKW